MKLVIVPNHVREAINAALDKAFEKVPDAAKDREELYRQLLEHFDQFGEVPEFDYSRPSQLQPILYP